MQADESDNYRRFSLEMCIFAGKVDTMENPYIKQYPDLMAGKKILYVHGFGSSAQSGTVKRIQEVLPQTAVVARDLPIHPQEAIALLKELCAAEQPDLIIGTSMGGMYAELLKGYDRILVNPAFEMGQTMHDHHMMGKQTFYNPRADGVQEFFVDKPLVKEYREATEQCFAHITPDEQARVYGLFGDEDPVVHTFDLFHSHYPNAIRFHGGHSLTDRSFMHGVLPVIRWIDDRQAQRQRNIVYIGHDCLEDSYGKPKSSFNKALDLLTEHYTVYIADRAPTNDRERAARTLAWVEQYAGVPVYDRVVFTNAPQLLYGDYFITGEDVTDFMGTTIAFGSDSFKTWEEVITYFERLGGQ